MIDNGCTIKVCKFCGVPHTKGKKWQARPTWCCGLHRKMYERGDTKGGIENGKEFVGFRPEPFSKDIE